MILPILGALAVGLSLGLLGSGGSILTVPALVFLVGQDEKVAIASSLAIVGCISAGAALQYASKRLVKWRSVALFAPPGMAGTYFGAWLSKFVTGETQLVLFAVVMFLVAFLMLKRLDVEGRVGHERAVWKLGLDGLVVGILTGFVGVGGGFLIIPALVLLGGLRMKEAVGTSLVIIALKSASGFWKYLGVLSALDLHVDWEVVGLFVVIGLAGSFAGSYLSSRMPQVALQRAFGVLLILMAGYILWTHLPSANDGSAEPITEIRETRRGPVGIPDGEVQFWGAMREVMGEGRTEGRVALSKLSGQSGVYGVGALAGLAGEVSIVDGEVWVAHGLPPTNGGTLLESTDEAEATLLVAAKVTTWTSQAIPRDLSANELEAFIKETATDLGADTKRPLPFLIEGEFSDLKFHVVNGNCPMVAVPDPEHKPARVKLSNATGTLVGFYAEDSHGVLTHPGSDAHVHVLIHGDAPQTGHVDAVAVRKGSVLKLPQSWPATDTYESSPNRSDKGDK